MKLEQFIFSGRHFQKLKIGASFAVKSWKHDKVPASLKELSLCIDSTTFSIIIIITKKKIDTRDIQKDYRERILKWSLGVLRS